MSMNLGFRAFCTENMHMLLEEKKYMTVFRERSTKERILWQQKGEKKLLLPGSMTVP